MEGGRKRQKRGGSTVRKKRRETRKRRRERGKGRIDLHSAFRTTGKKGKLKSSSRIHSSPKVESSIMILWEDSLNSN